MAEFHYALGLDVGIGSVGWAVLQNDFDGEPIRIQDHGVRIFDKAEQPKTGASLALPRREARSARRRLRRRRHRLERIRYLLEQANIMSVIQHHKLSRQAQQKAIPGHAVYRQSLHHSGEQHNRAGTPAGTAGIASAGAAPV